MSTMTLMPPTTAAPARTWLPGAARPIDAACPACGGLDSLVYSVGDAYVACLGCGWQRRLEGPAGLQAALAGYASTRVPWRYLLSSLAQTDPDALPPVAALLWRQTGPDTWQGPSRTQPDTTYTITRDRHYIKCDCPHLRGRCWHKLRAAELGCVDLTAASDLWPD